MDRFTLASIFIAFALLTIRPTLLEAASAQAATCPAVAGCSAPVPVYSNKEMPGKSIKKDSRKLKAETKQPAKLHKTSGKRTNRVFDGTARDYLILCLSLLGLSILFFALSGPSGILGILGSLFALGAVAFFVLWLLKMRKSMRPS